VAIHVFFSFFLIWDPLCSPLGLFGALLETEWLVVGGDFFGTHPGFVRCSHLMNLFFFIFFFSNNFPLCCES